MTIVQRLHQHLARAARLDLRNWFRNVVGATAMNAQLCHQVSRSAGGDGYGQVMELILFENRECSISREACGESARGCDVNTAVAQRTGILLHARRVACLV